MKGGQQPLDERKERILREIVEGYVRHGEPVGSKAVAERTDLGVSSATIRNEMGILEREGYISAPHTSAGRVPTDKGYRYYVDVLARKVAPAPERRREIERCFAGAVAALDDLLERTSQLLSELTDYTSLAAFPPLHESRLERVEVVRLGGTRLLVVCVGEGGWYDERPVDLGAEVSDEVLAQALRVVGALVAGQTPAEAARRLATTVTPAELAGVVRAVGQALSHAACSPARVFTGGTSKLVMWEPVETAQRVLELLEHHAVEPLFPALPPDNVSVRIGHELPVEDFHELSLIAAGYRFGKSAGSLGVLGPTRMDYPSVIGTVAEVAAALSRVLRRLSG